VYIWGPAVANPSVQDWIAPLKHISHPPPIVALKNRIKAGVMATGEPSSE
jgi:hypothetical protein